MIYSSSPCERTCSCIYLMWEEQAPYPCCHCWLCLTLMKANSNPYTWGAEQCLAGLVLAPPVASVVRSGLTSSLLVRAPFCWSRGGCSSTGPDRAVGSQGFLLLAASVCQPGAGQFLPCLGMLEHGRGREWVGRAHSLMGLGSEDTSLLPLVIPADLVSVRWGILPLLIPVGPAVVVVMGLILYWCFGVIW